MSKYYFNNFGGLVLFSLPPKRFFERFLLRGTQRTRRYLTRYVRVLRDVGGACTGRPKSLGLAPFFWGCESEPKKPSPRHDLSLIHISEPTRPLYISYAVFCLKKKVLLQSRWVPAAPTFCTHIHTAPTDVRTACTY